MRYDPFTGEEYVGRVVVYDCDGCGKDTYYEEDAYGQDFLVLCDTCSGRFKDRVVCGDDLAVWPDESWCNMCDLEEFLLFQSDDYRVVFFDSLEGMVLTGEVDV